MVFVCTADGKKNLGLEGYGIKTVAEPAGPSFDGPKPATRWKGLE